MLAVDKKREIWRVWSGRSRDWLVQVHARSARDALRVTRLHGFVLSRDASARLVSRDEWMQGVLSCMR